MKESNVLKGRNSKDAIIDGQVVAFINRNSSEYPVEVGAGFFAPVQIEKEKDIFRALSLESGKPADIIEKMITGQIRKFLAEVIDCSDPLALSTFWQQILGCDVDSRTDTAEWVALSGVLSLGYLGFKKVPEKKAVKNRVHFDVDVESIEAASVVEEQTNYFQVMLELEGNEFCIILRKN